MSVQIHDSSPERRNLSVLSVSIILFHLAEGKVTNGKLTLNMLNIEFANTNILEFSIPIFLLWFLFRYWVVERDNMVDYYHKETCELNVRCLYRFFVNNSVTAGYIRMPDCDKTEEIDEKVIHKLKGFGGAMVSVFVAFKLFFTRPTLTGYTTPFYLAIGALYFISPTLLVVVLTIIFIPVIIQW